MKYPHKLVLAESCGVRWYVILWRVDERTWYPSHYDSSLDCVLTVMHTHVLSDPSNEWDWRLYDSAGMALDIDMMLEQEKRLGVDTGVFAADEFSTLANECQADEVPFG